MSLDFGAVERHASGMSNDGGFQARLKSAQEKLKSALGDLPRWALIVAAIACVVIVGEVVFLVVQSGGDGGTAAAGEEPLPCNSTEAENAVNADRFAQEVRDLGAVPPLSKVLEIYDLQLVGCADLTGDGIDEMVAQFTELGIDPETTPNSPRPWAIYQAQEGRWIPALIRTHVPNAEVTIGDGVVNERSPGLAEGDPSCCPTGVRAGEVSWDGEQFTYKPESGPRGRTIALADGVPETLAGFGLQEGSLPDALELFGPPSSYTPQDELCPASWEDLGLEIDFANLGGLDPCGLDGRVASVRVEGLEAKQAGWQTQEGATVDMTEEELRVLYPEMQPAEQATFSPGLPEGELFTLVERPSPIGVGELTPSLSARISDARVLGFEISVGAAGE